MASAIDPDRVLKLREDAVVWHEVEGEVLALTLREGRYVAANASATELWRMLTAGASLRALAGALALRWGLTADAALADAAAFVDELDVQGLLERGG